MFYALCTTFVKHPEDQEQFFPNDSIPAKGVIDLANSYLLRCKLTAKVFASLVNLRTPTSLFFSLVPFPVGRSPSNKRSPH